MENPEIRQTVKFPRPVNQYDTFLTFRLPYDDMPGITSASLGHTSVEESVEIVAPESPDATID